MECTQCHQALTPRGNRRFWVRSSDRTSEIGITVCGRQPCQEQVREAMPSGTVYWYESVNQNGQARAKRLTLVK